MRKSDNESQTLHPLNYAETSHLQKHTIVNGFIILMKFIFVVEQVYDDSKKCFRRFKGRKYAIVGSDIIITCQKDL